MYEEVSEAIRGSRRLVAQDHPLRCFGKLGDKLTLIATPTHFSLKYSFHLIFNVLSILTAKSDSATELQVPHDE